MALSADWSLSRVAEFRAATGLSQMVLAERVGLSRPTLAKIEAGEGSKLSTINFFVASLQEEFGDLFDQIAAKPVGENALMLVFERKARGVGGAGERALEWGEDMKALAWKVMEVARSTDTAARGAFHDDLLTLLDSYVRLTGLEIHIVGA